MIKKWKNKYIQKYLAQLYAGGMYTCHLGGLCEVCRFAYIEL